MTDEIYDFAPRWQYLDADDMLYLICELSFKVRHRRTQQADFPARLVRHFKKVGWVHHWQPILSVLDAMDLPFLSQFLDIRMPAAEHQRRLAAGWRYIRHFTLEEDAEEAVYEPDWQYLDADELAYVLPWLKASVTGERLRQGNFPASLRPHFCLREEPTEAEEAVA